MFVYVACMLEIPISPVFKGVSSEIRVCCASFVYTNFINRNLYTTVKSGKVTPQVLHRDIYAFRLQYL